MTMKFVIRDVSNVSNGTTTATKSTLTNQQQPQAESATSATTDGSAAKEVSTNPVAAATETTTTTTTTTTQDPITTSIATSISDPTRAMTTVDYTTPSPATATIATPATETATPAPPAIATTQDSTGNTAAATQNPYTAAAAATTTAQSNEIPATDGTSITSTTIIIQQQGSPQTTIVTSTSISTSFSPSSSACVSNQSATCSSTTKAAAIATSPPPSIPAGEIAGIAIGIFLVLSLVTACICLYRRKQKRGTENKHVSKRISPFNYVVDEKKSFSGDLEGGEEKQQQSDGDNHLNVITMTQQNHSATSDLCNEQEANEDNLYYCNSTDFNYQNNHNRYSMSTMTSMIQEGTYNHPVAGAFMMIPTALQESYQSMTHSSSNSVATSLYPPQTSRRSTHGPSSNLTTAKPTSTIFDISNSSRNRSSLIIDDRPFSALQQYHTPLSHGISNDKNSFMSHTNNPYYDSFGVMKKENYRLSLHNPTLFLQQSSAAPISQCSTQSTASSRNPSILRQGRGHQRQESDNLDPQIIHKMSLWDDHLVVTPTVTGNTSTIVRGGAPEIGDAWSHEDRQSMMMISK